MKKIILALGLMLLAQGCTENERVSGFGGNGTMSLPPGQKLINVTWNEQDNTLWYCMRPMRSGEQPEVYTVTEKSSWGVFKGSYTINEVK